MKPALGIIAGSGGLPGKLIDAALADNRDVFVVGVKGEANPALLERVSHDWVDLGSLGSLFRMLKHNRCEQVVFAGPVRRPSLRNLSLDWYTLKLFPRILRAAKKGDGALLSLLVAQIEQEGFQVVGAEQVSKDLLVPEGALGDLVPTSDDLEDIRKGARVIAKLGELDIGQAAVVRDGLVLGVEAAEGTDNLIERCGVIPGDGGGVLVKISKPGQERRVDLPTIGVTTVEKVAAAGLNGIALEADGALILDREQVLAKAEAEGIFIYGISHKILKQ